MLANVTQLCCSHRHSKKNLTVNVKLHILNQRLVILDQCCTENASIVDQICHSSYQDSSEEEHETVSVKSC